LGIRTSIEPAWLPSLNLSTFPVRVNMKLSEIGAADRAEKAMVDEVNNATANKPIFKTQTWARFYVVFQIKRQAIELSFYRQVGRLKAAQTEHHSF